MNISVPKSDIAGIRSEYVHAGGIIPEYTETHDMYYVMYVHVGIYIPVLYTLRSIITVMQRFSNSNLGS